MQRDRRIRAGVTAIAAAAGLAAVGGLGGGAVAETKPAGVGEPFTIYSSLPLHGDSRPQSADITRAMRLALRDSGGRAGNHRITYISLNDATAKPGFWDPVRVARNARKAASNPRTIAYLGEFNSGASAVAIPILNQAGVLQVSPSNTVVGLTRSEGAEEGEPDKYYPSGKRTYGRVVPADHMQAAAAVSYMQDEGCTNAYIISHKELYGRAIAARLARIGRERGLAILANEAIAPSPANVRAAADRVTAAHAACFYFAAITQSNAIGLFRAVAAGSPSIKLFGPDGLAESAFTEKLGASLAKRVFITNPTLARTAYPPRGQKFFSDFKAKYGRYPEPYAIYGYEAMSVVLSAIRRADGAGTDAQGRQAVVDAFFGTRGRRSVLGTYDIDANGDTTLSDYGGFRSVGGRLVFHKVIKSTP